MHNVVRSYIDPSAVERVSAVLRSGWLNEGPQVKAFEAKLEEELGLCNPVAVNSDTSAMHLALILAGVGPGDEVILPPQTFIATGTVILMCGATPVFADVQPGTGNISPESVREKVNHRTKAIMAVHWGGYPCDMAELGEIAKGWGVPVIEDAAQALGATYCYAPLGSISPFTCFSFQSTKHVTCGEGGVLCCTDPDNAERARALRWFGVPRSDPRWTLGERDAVASELGFKYHMNDIAAALGLANLEHFLERLWARQRRGTHYRERLAKVPGLRLLDIQFDRTHAYWFFSCFVERREDFAHKLAEAGFSASVVHRRIDRHPVFGGLRHDLPGQEQFEATHIALPLHERLPDEEAERMLDLIREGW